MFSLSINYDLFIITQQIIYEHVILSIRNTLEQQYYNGRLHLMSLP